MWARTCRGKRLPFPPGQQAGRESAAPSTLHAMPMPGTCRYCLEAQEGLRSPYGFDSRRVRKALRHALAVFTTCTGAGSKLLDGCRFGAVVVDEASQVLFEKALVPVHGLRGKTR